MNKFDEREKGFEKKFAKDEELQFKIASRRNKYLGQWVSEKFGYNPLVWDENVELMIKNLSIPEHYRNSPVKYGAYRGPAKNYVKSIYSRYMAWKLNE